MDTYIKDKGKCHSMVKWKPSMILLFMKGLNQSAQCAYHFPKVKSGANSSWLTQFLVMALDNKIKLKLRLRLILISVIFSLSFSIQCQLIFSFQFHNLPPLSKCCCTLTVCRSRYCFGDCVLCWLPWNYHLSVYQDCSFCVCLSLVWQQVWVQNSHSSEEHACQI